MSRLLRLRRLYLFADSDVDDFVTVRSSLEVRLNEGIDGGAMILSVEPAGDGAFCSELDESSLCGERRYLLGDDLGVVSKVVRDKSGMLDERLMKASFPGLVGLADDSEETVDVDEVLRWPDFCWTWGTPEGAEMVRVSCRS